MFKTILRRSRVGRWLVAAVGLLSVVIVILVRANLQAQEGGSDPVASQEQQAGDSVVIIDFPSLNTVGGEDEGKKWTVATLQPPLKDPVKWTARNDPEGNHAAKFQYIRSGAAAVDVAWDGNAAEIKFDADNKLKYKVGQEWMEGVACMDGDANAPKLKVVDGLLRIHSVIHGDVIVVVDTVKNVSDRVYLVKSMSLNDANRIGFANLQFHGDFAGLAANAKSTILGTIKFCLEDGPGTAQELERVRNRDLYADLVPPLAVLDIPSAHMAGIILGDQDVELMSRDDMSHYHNAATATRPQSVTTAVTALDAEVAAQEQALGIDYYTTKYYKAADRAKYVAEYQAVKAKLVAAQNAITGDATAPFQIYHTYEIVSPSYYRGNTSDTIMQGGDPLRNVKAVAGSPPTIVLFKPPDVNDTMSWHDMPNTYNMHLEVSFFVDRGGRVRLVAPSLRDVVRSLMIADALGDLP